MENLQNILVKLLLTDKDYRSSRDCKVIQRMYNTASNDEKALIDDIFVTLTGYSLNTIVNDQENILTIGEE